MADYKKFPSAPEGTPVSNFVHLHLHSDYSLLDGASKIDTYVERAKALNMPALALTDHGNMFGALNFEKLCHVNGINPIVGEEFYVAYGSHKEHNFVPYSKEGKGRYFHLILLCENQTGYKNMSWLSSIAYTDGFWNKPRIDFELLKKYHEGLICLSACIQGEIPQLLLAGRNEEAEKVALEYKELFGPDHYYIEIQDHGLPDQKVVAEKLIALSKKLDIPLVLTNDVHYCNKDDAEAQDVLRCIGFKKLLNEPHQTMGEGRTEWYLKTEQEMSLIFADKYPEEMKEAMANTVKIANMCDLTIHQYSTQELKDCLPRFELPEAFRKHEDYSKNQDDYVRYLVEEGLKKRYPEITEQIRTRCEYELGIIFQMGFSGYFLIVWEFINWSKENGIPIGPGRGSGAGSLVAYCMGITDIDPFRFKLIFERFLNPERVSMPDFDIDMDFDYRQDIIEHTKKTYGEPQVGHIVTFGTLKPKNVIADVGRVLGIPLSEVNMLKKLVSENLKAKLIDSFNPPNEKFPDGGQLAPYRDDPRYKKLFDLAFKLEGLIRNTGLHASGMVIGLTPLPDWAPVFTCSSKEKDENGDYKREVAVQYTMDIIEPCGLVKFDYLGLKTLSLIRYAETIINKHKSPGAPDFSAANVSDTDEETYKMFAKGDTVAVFQFESPGMQKWMKKLQPTCLEDLVAMNALYRPGPMDYIPNFVDGKNDPSTVKYPDPCLEDILKETYGVMVYQEQVMQVSQKIAGFSLGGADMLRRAMGKKKPEVLMGKKKEFIDGAIKEGFTEKHADEIFEIMIPFAGYGFNKSHAAAYTVLAYRTGYLKCHYPAEFMAANLTNEINSTDKLPEYIEEARKMGVPVDPPDVNRSDKIFDVVDGHIVFGLRGIKGMGDGPAGLIVAEREKNGKYKSFMDFLERLDLRAMGKKAIDVLVKTGGFDHVGEETGENLTRATMIANFDQVLKFIDEQKADEASGQLGLFDGMDEKFREDFKFEIVPELPKLELLEMEKDLIGCYVSGHPLDDYREIIEKAATVTTANVMKIARSEKAMKDEFEAANGSASSWRNRYNGKTYTAIGSISELREIMTKKGDQMAFAKINDMGGQFDVTFFPKTWAALKSQIANDKVVALVGKIDLRDDAPQMLVDSISDINSLEEKSKTEVHIQIAGGFSRESDILEVRDFLYSVQGPCKVFFHIETSQGEYILRASGTTTAPATKEFLQEVALLPGVKDAWNV